MQLKWGTYAWDANSVEIGKTVDYSFDDAERPFSYRVTLHTSGRLFATGQAALTVAESALQTALSVPYKDLIFFNDDLSKSAIQLTTADSLTGVVIDNIRFGSTHGAEYATIRSFEFTAHAEYRLPRALNSLLSYKETFQYSGGGPLFAVQEALDGPPVRVMIRRRTMFRVVQSGEAVGFNGYPPVPALAFPAFHRGEPQVRRESPRRRGGSYQSFPISWEYTFESPGPLTGIPTPWPLAL